MVKLNDYKILVKWCFAEVFEDDYERGEHNYVNTWDMKDYVGTYDSIEDLVDALSNWGFSDKVKDYGFFEDNDGEILSDILTNDEGYKASKHEIEQWENGEIKLYVSRLSCGVELITTRPMTNDDAKMLGLEIY